MTTFRLQAFATSHRPFNRHGTDMRNRLVCGTLLVFCTACLVACDDQKAAQLAVGTIERDRIELVAEAPEPIAEIVVGEGQRVSAGDVLVRLDEERLQAEVDRTEGGRDRVMALFAELERGPRHERIDEVKAALAGAKGVLDRDRKELDRARALYQKGVGSRAGLDAARASYDSSQARRDQALAELEALETGATSEELDQARAAVAEAQGALRAARIRLERLTVRAPVDGQVDALPFEIGERPPAGAVVAVMLADNAPYARVYVPELIRARVVPGGAATVSVDGIERRFDARVRMVSGQAMFTPFFALTEKDRGRLVYLAELELVDPEARDLPTGIPAEAEFHLDGVGDGGDAS
jgi:HlyD family secretion protein